MTPTDFGKLIKSNFYGIFLLYGEEQYLKQHYLKLAQKSTCSDSSNLITISGEGITLREVCQQAFEIASMPSMDMSKKFITIFDIEWKKVNDDDLDYLEDITNEMKSYDDCVIVFDTRPEFFDAGNEKKPSKLFTRLSKIITPVQFAKESPARLAAWIQKHFNASKISINSDLANLIVKYCGRDMTTLNNEITKLIAYATQDGRNELKEEDIKNVSVFTNEIDTFDFSNAVLNGHTERAFEILNDMKLHKEAPELVLSGMMRVYGDLYTVKILLESGMVKSEIAQKIKMHEYKAGLYIQRANSLSRKGLEKAISLCHEADTKIKSTSLDSYTVLDILLIKLSMTGKIR